MLRDPAQVIPLPAPEPAAVEERLRHRVTGDWWAVLDRLAVRLLVSREYEHLLVSVGLDEQGRPDVSYLPLPHPSGIAVNREAGTVAVALTRNPNQVLTLRTRGLVHGRRPLLPSASLFFPGSMYFHDLAYVGGRLHANAVGKNHVVEILGDGTAVPRWWPRVMDVDGGPDERRNWLQLNSIAAGETLQGSFFSASTDRRLRYPPGHPRFGADRTGVIFSGATREVVARGLTRPHSARLTGGRLWVDNSGYGEVGVIEGDRFEPVARLHGWTRGLAVAGDVLFVGTSRVLPRFAHYAPGVRQAVCGLHAIEQASGRVLGSLTWPVGNQIFAVDWVPARETTGFPYNRRRSRLGASVVEAFYLEPSEE